MSNTENENESFAITMGDTGINLQIDKDDLLAIGIANYEQEQLSKRKDLQATIRANHKRGKEIEAELHKRIEAAGEGEDKKIQSFIRAGKRLGIEVSVNPTARLTHKDADPDTLSIAVAREITAVHSSRVRSGYYHTLGIVHSTIEVDEETRALWIEQRDLENKNQELGQELAEVISNLNSLATKEREVRAALAMKALESTDQGRSLLQAMSSGANPFMLTDDQS
jgi:hypothetical protein